MTKEQAGLRSEVETLLADVGQTHRYSMSRIYGLYNRIFGKEEKPQSCASCLIRKVRDLKDWLDKQPEETLSAGRTKRKRSKK